MRTYNFCDHVTGTTFAGVVFTVLRESVDGDPVDLTNTVIRMQLRASAEASKEIEFSTLNGKLEIVNAEDGQFQMPEQLITVKPLSWVYDIRIEFPDGKIKTWVKGAWNILNNVTKDRDVR